MASPTWPQAQPELSVCISAYNRAGFLPELVAALEAQQLAPSRFEVIVVDNGSADGTWATLEELSARTPLALLAIHVEPNRGPAGGRNAAAAEARAALLVFTDDDCLPAPGWLAAVADAFEAGADIVQGRTLPTPGGPTASPWDRTLRIERPTPWHETCNLGYRRALFDAAGGFDERDAVTGHRSDRPFGEDVLLGWQVRGLGGAYRFEHRAVVHHRWLPRTYRELLAERRRLADFPALVGASRGLAGARWLGLFLTPATAATDLAIVSLVLGAVTRRWRLAIGALPWLVLRWSEARFRPGRPIAVRLLQIAVGDAVGAVALARGSLRHRRIVL